MLLLPPPFFSLPEEVHIKEQSMSRKWRPRICCTWIEWMSHERQEWKCTQRRCLCCIRCFTTQEGLNGAKRSRPPWLCVIWRLFSMCNLWASAIHLLRAVCVWEKPRVWPLAQGWTPIPPPFILSLHSSSHRSLPLLILHSLWPNRKTHTHTRLFKRNTFSSMRDSHT